MWRITILLLTLSVVSQAAYLGKRKTASDCPDEGGAVADCTHSPLDISLVVDASSSIGEANFARCLAFLEDFVQMFHISQSTVRISMVTYGVTAYEQGAFGLVDHDNVDDLRQTIASTPYAAGSATNTSGGIWYMLQNHYPQVRPNVRHIVMVITDGQSQNKRATKAASQDAHQVTEDVFAIGVGSGVSVAELHTIASDNRHVFIVDSYDMLTSIKRRLTYQACDVPSYPECEMDPVDIAFVIDSSRSIGSDNFTKGMDFVRDFVDSFQVDPAHVRVAAVTFGEKVFTEDIFQFDTYSTKQEVLDRLNRTTYQQGAATHTWKGIAEMRDNLMSKARQGVPHICIVITDGESQSTRKTTDEAQQAKALGIVMYAVGVGKVGDTLNAAELQAIASGQENVVVVSNYQQLNLVKEQLINVTCSGILGSTRSKGQAQQLLFDLDTSAV